MNSAELHLDRFCGREIYPITKATWNLYLDDDLRMMNLCLLVEAGQGILLHEDTETLNAEPCWEINIVEKDLNIGSLVTGAKFTVPFGYNEERGGHMTNFYYCEHEGSEDNTVQILAVENDRFLIQMTGETIDVNYYDGSKPATKLSVQTWFTHNTNTQRSVQ